MSNRIASIEQCCNPLKLLHNLHTGRGRMLRQRSLNAECKHLHTVLTDVFLSPCSNILHPSYNHVFWKCWTSCYPWVWKGNLWKAQSITSKHETFICNQLTRCLIGASTFVKKGLANDQSVLFKRPHFFLSPKLKLLMTDRNIWTECNTTHTHTLPVGAPSLKQNMLFSPNSSHWRVFEDECLSCLILCLNHKLRNPQAAALIWNTALCWHY